MAVSAARRRLPAETQATRLGGGVSMTRGPAAPPSTPRYRPCLSVVASCPARWRHRCPPKPTNLDPFQPFNRIETKKMTNADQERWSKVKERLRAEVGEDVYSSWFARMDLEADRRRNRAPVGADALPQELDPVALHRTRAGLLAGGRDRRATHRGDRALGGDRARAAVKPRPETDSRRRSAPRQRQRRGRTGRCVPAMPPGTTRSAARRSIRG